MNLKIEYVDIDSIKEYENNAKLHPETQISQIKKSMDEFGNLDPIGVWHGEIVEGHGRWLAAKELGYKQVPIIVLDDLTDEQRRAYALVHNKLTMNSGFDFDILESELADIANFDMTDFGFNLDEISEGYDGDGADEISLGEFDDEQFECECPRCGFRFNPREKKKSGA